MASPIKATPTEIETAYLVGKWAWSEGFEITDNPWPDKRDPRGWDWRRGWFEMERRNK